MDGDPGASDGHRQRVNATPENPVPGGSRWYLRQFDLFRVVAFVLVIAQHAVLWPVPGGSKVGWSLVMVLHATREVFFFLAAFVACYSQLLRPRWLGSFWVRRLGMILVPYLAWTGIYVVYTIVHTRYAAVGPTVVHDLLNGYYQLYFLVVLFQIYIVLPGILWIVRHTRGHHGWILGSSVVLQLAMMTLSHYFAGTSGALRAVRGADLTLITPRYWMGYQLYVVLGVLAAYHFGTVQRFVERHSGAILWGVLAVGALTEGYYAAGLIMGNTPGHASDLFQPVATVWFVAACAGLWAGGWRWARRVADREPTRVDRIVTWGSDASGGYYLSHVLVLQLIFSGLTSAGLTGPSTWGYASVVLLAGTLIGAGILVGILMRTPLRWVLTGPNRTAERESYPTYPVVAAAAAAGAEPRTELATT